jgi:hypothetical protein
MALSYMDAIEQGYTTVQAHCASNPFDYEQIEWAGGDAIPSKDDLDAWIVAEDFRLAHAVTKYQFRQLFTMNERVAIDNYAMNPNIPANYKAIMLTLLKDLELSQVVELNNPAVIQGVHLLEQLGLIAAGRAAVVLSNTPPA